MGRSRSRSRGRHNRSHSRSRSESPEGFRVHVADLGLDPSKREIEKTFEKFGSILETWVAKSPPCFAFIVYRHKESADTAIRDMDGQVLSGGRIRVTMARPRNRGGRKVHGFDPEMRCFSCGERGHFSRDCNMTSRPHFEAGYKSESSIVAVTGEMGHTDVAITVDPDQPVHLHGEALVAGLDLGHVNAVVHHSHVIAVVGQHHVTAIVSQGRRIGCRVHGTRTRIVTAIGTERVEIADRDLHHVDTVTGLHPSHQDVASQRIQKVR